MNECYRRGCRQLARFRMVRLTGARWRRWLHLPPRSWQTCDEHRFDPIMRARRGRLHHG